MSKAKKKTIEGPFGLKMLEETAHYLDEILKKIPRDCRTLQHKSVTVTSEFEPGERADISLVSTDSVDRDGDVVLPDTITLDQFRKNPCVLWNHQSDQPPVGKAIWIKPVPGGLKAKTVYAARPDDFEGDWLPDTVYALVKDGYLPGRSIGFLAMEMRDATTKELEARPDWKQARCIISSALLLEYSVVPVPSNPDALQLAVAKGLRLPPDLKKPLPTKLPTKQLRLNEDRIVREVIARLKGKV